MRLLRRSLLIACATVLLASACDAPPAGAPVGAAVVDLPDTVEPLPDAVAETVRKLKQIAASGTYRDMAALADATPGFRSNNANMTHKDYWYLKMRSGDWPMAQADKLLGYRYAVADTSMGKVYIWPWMARLKPEQITPVAERDISRLLGEGQAEVLRRGGVWPGYVLGIAEDGTWLYFVSGSG
jgi:hypothetical protein